MYSGYLRVLTTRCVTRRSLCGGSRSRCWRSGSMRCLRPSSQARTFSSASALPRATMTATDLTAEHERSRQGPRMNLTERWAKKAAGRSRDS
eukprot:3441834-Rhodomonas_salina.5